MSNKYEDLIKNARMNADCGEHMSPEEVTTLLNVVETTFAALAAENAVLKDDYRDTPALKRMGWPKTPATDAAIANIQAQGVEMCADALDRGADDAERDGFDDGMKFLRAEAESVREFAAQLRQGAEHE